MTFDELTVRKSLAQRCIYVHCDQDSGYLQWWVVIDTGQRKIIYRRHSRSVHALEEVENLRQTMFFDESLSAREFVDLAK